MKKLIYLTLILFTGILQAQEFDFNGTGPWQPYFSNIEQPLEQFTQTKLHDCETLERIVTPVAQSTDVVNSVPLYESVIDNGNPLDVNGDGDTADLFWTMQRTEVTYGYMSNGQNVGYVYKHVTSEIATYTLASDENRANGEFTFALEGFPEWTVLANIVYIPHWPQIIVRRNNHYDLNEIGTYAFTIRHGANYYSNATDGIHGNEVTFEVYALPEAEGHYIITLNEDESITIAKE